MNLRDHCGKHGETHAVIIGWSLVSLAIIAIIVALCTTSCQSSYKAPYECKEFCKWSSLHDGIVKYPCMDSAYTECIDATTRKELSGEICRSMGTIMRTQEEIYLIEIGLYGKCKRSITFPDCKGMESYEVCK